MPAGDDKSRRADDRPRRAQTATERDHEGLAARRLRDARVPEILYEEITGRHEGAELERLRAERDAAQRLAIAELRADLRTTDKLVNEHNTKLEIGVIPVVKQLPKDLEAIRAAQVQLDAAFTAAIRNTDDAIADMSRQLQQHSEQLTALQASQRTHSDRLRIVETTQAAHVAAIATLSDSRDINVKVGGWVRRNLTSIIVTALSAVAGLVGGYLSSHLGVTP